MQTQVSDSEHWSIQDSAALYGLTAGGSVLLHQWAGTHQRSTLRDRGEAWIWWIWCRSSKAETSRCAADSLRRHPRRLGAASCSFERAIAQYSYPGRYQGVFPVKCNQQRHVVEELVSCGKRWNFGLEAGSKAELLIALSLLDDPEALLICNGYKDRLYIETAILARRLDGNRWW